MCSYFKNFEKECPLARNLKNMSFFIYYYKSTTYTNYYLMPVYTNLQRRLRYNLTAAPLQIQKPMTYV